MPEEKQSSPQQHIRRFACPKCGVKLRVEVPDAAVVIVCPKCFEEFNPSAIAPLGSLKSPVGKPIVHTGEKRPESSSRAPDAKPDSAAPATAAAPTDSSATAAPKPLRSKNVPTPNDLVPAGEAQGKPATASPQRGGVGALTKIIILAFVLIALSAAVWVSLYYNQKQELTNSSASPTQAPHEAAGTSTSASTSVGSNPPPSEAPPAPTLTPRQREALAAAESAARALASPTWQDLLQHVRAPEAVEPLMRDYYAEDLFQPERASNIISTTLASNAGGTRLAYVSLQMPDFREQRVVLERVGDRFLADWESLVAFQEMPWAEFQRERPTEPKAFRVGVELGEVQALSELEGAPLADFYVFEVHTSASGLGTTVYMKKTQPQATELFSRLQTGRRHDAILNLRYMTIEGLGDFVEIADLVQFGWLKGYGSPAPEDSPLTVDTDAPL